jgi:hypothetical protein
MKKRFTSGLIAAAFWSGQAVAQTPMPITNDDFSKETENPVTLPDYAAAALSGRLS